MAASEVYKSKFPPTKLLDACYSDIVPDKSVHQTNIQLLESALRENSKLLLLMPTNPFTSIFVNLQEADLLLKLHAQVAKLPHHH